MAAFAIIYLALIGFYIYLSVVCWQKGKKVFSIVGILVFNPLLWFGAARLAKPGSTWAKKHYEHDPLKKSMSIARFPAEQAKVEYIEKMMTQHYAKLDAEIAQR